MIARILLVVATVGLVTSTIFLVLALVAAVRFARRSRRPSRLRDPDLPGATIMKPVHGMEPRLRESLESFFLQDYPRFEIIFGARSADDAALETARDLMRQYPQVSARIALSGDPPWPNAKIYSLERMLAQSRYDYLVISDSDVEVGPAYLRQVMGALLEPGVGCVTCIYRGLPVGGLWALLEALGMSVDMTSGVLIADMLEGMRFALGPTMATRRDILEKIGGFQALREYHSDDYLFGNYIAAAGYRVVVPREAINHVVLNRALRPSLAHQVRWMKSTRHSRPKGHLGSGLTFAVPFGLLGLLAGAASHHWKWGLAIFAAAWLNRVVQALAIGWGVARDPRALRFAWLYPLRDLVGSFLWAASYAGNEMDWRGERYRFETGGKIVRIGEATAAAEPAETSLASHKGDG
jgi:ceramide glucosyltransferase